MRAVEPLKLVPDATPEPLLLNVTAAAVAFAVVAVVATVADDAVPALPIMLMFQVPLTPSPVKGVPPRADKAAAAVD